MIPDNKKSFLWLTENYPPSRGGMAQSCDRIIQGLREKGLHIHIYHFTNRKEQFITEKKVNGSYTALPVFDSESHTLNLALNHIRLKKDDFHEILIFGGYLPIIAAPVFSRLLGKKMVTLLRGNDFDVSIFSPRKRGLLHEAIVSSRAIGAITKDKFEKIRALYPESNAIYTPNGIRLDEWSHQASDLEFSIQWRKDHAMERICIGVIGQLKEKKGIDVLIRSLDVSLLRDNIFLLLIGEIEQKYLDQLKELNLEHQVYPFQDRFELLKYYGACDGIVIPSHYDGMPNVLMEAGALGIPVIGSNIDGMKDVIEPDIGGFLFEPGDSNACRDKLIQFISLSGNDRKEMGKQLKEKVYADFSHEREAENYYKILSDEYNHEILI